MRFKTVSGTEYILTDIELQLEATGEPCPSVGPQGIPVVLSYTGNLSRVGKPMRNIYTGEHIEKSDEFHPVEFARMPTVGESFAYYHQQWAGCYSTPVSEIEE